MKSYIIIAELIKTVLLFGFSLGNVSLKTYDNVKAVAISGKLLGPISHATEFTTMPIGVDKLDVCSINAIKKWIEEGTQNN